MVLILWRKHGHSFRFYMPKLPTGYVSTIGTYCESCNLSSSTAMWWCWVYCSCRYIYEDGVVKIQTVENWLKLVKTNEKELVQGWQFLIMLLGFWFYNSPKNFNFLLLSIIISLLRHTQVRLMRLPFERCFPSKRNS